MACSVRLHLNAQRLGRSLPATAWSNLRCAALSSRKVLTRKGLWIILRHGQQVVVEQPSELRQRVAEEAAALAKLYQAV
jgi:hypothetical protein